MIRLFGDPRFRILIVLSLFLGLAPFFPEPHLIGKLRWLAGGGVGMKPVDYLDLVFHGTVPVMLLAFMTIKLIKR